MNTKQLYSSLVVPGIQCTTHVGWTDAELAQAQGVVIDLALQLGELPPATHSDQLEYTFDYSPLARRVVHLCSNARYRLLERLGRALYDDLRAVLPAHVQIWLEVSKRRAPLAEADESPRFALGDWQGAAALAGTRYRIGS